MKEKTWECNLHYKHIEHFMPRKNSGKTFSIEHVEEVDIIANSIIWLNSDIVVNGKPMLNKKCLSRGIIYVKDFFNNEGKPMTYEEFNAKHGTFLNFIEYYGITKAIQTHVNDKLQNGTFETEGIGKNYTMFLDKKIQ